MKQRLALAQALRGRPKLLILDEPSADLDPLGRRDVRELVLALKQRGVAVLINSHLLGEVARICDTVSVLSKGQTLANGALATIVPDGQTLEESLCGINRKTVRCPDAIASAIHGQQRQSGGRIVKAARGTAAVARYTHIELRRRRVILAFVLLGLALIGSIWLMAVVSADNPVTGDELNRIVLRFLSTSPATRGAPFPGPRLAVSLCAFAIGLVIINHDIESGAIVSILAKPAADHRVLLAVDHPRVVCDRPTPFEQRSLSPGILNWRSEPMRSSQAIRASGSRAFPRRLAQPRSCSGWLMYCCFLPSSGWRSSVSRSS